MSRLASAMTNPGGKTVNTVQAPTESTKERQMLEWRSSCRPLQSIRELCGAIAGLDCTKHLGACPSSVQAPFVMQTESARLANDPA